VPSGLADHRIEYGCRDFLYVRPAFTNGFPQRIQATRQDALFAQENGTKLHPCTLFDVAGVTTWPEPVCVPICDACIPLAEDGSSVLVLASESARLDGSPENPVASDWLAGRYGRNPLRLRAER